MKLTRPYQLKARAAGAEAKRDKIVDAAIGLLKTRFRSEIRLEDIAAAAGVTVPTVLANFGSKADLLTLALYEVISRASVLRRSVAPGDPAAAVHGLYEHYESIGDWVVRNVMEEADPQLLAIGRERHREWIEIYFGAALSGRSPEDRARRFDALLAACDVTIWKLLRRDLGRSVANAEAVVLLTVQGILKGD